MISLLPTLVVANRRRVSPWVLAFACVYLFAGCATSSRVPADPASSSKTVAVAAPSQEPSRAKDAARDDPTTHDPFEGFNRAMFEFNDWFDRYVGKPVAKGYRWVLPSPVRRGTSNFFSNLLSPVVIVNDLLQGKPLQATMDTARFVVNTTIGLLGIFDPASHMDLPRHDEDFGQTLAVWGVGEGPYIVWPFIGPRNLRDSVGLVADWQLWTPSLVSDIDSDQRLGLAVWYFVDTRASLLEASDIIDQAAGQDPYIFVREAYRQRRQHLISDGKVTTKPEIESLLFEEDPPRATPPAEPATSPAAP